MVRRLLRRIRRALTGAPQASSTEYEIVDRESALALRLDGWFDPSVAERQDNAFRRLLDGMRAGEPRADFVAAAEAVRATGIDEPAILEVGCGSGYYSEVLPYMLGKKIRYTGVDYSEPMIVLARARYPDASFAVADAVDLPFEDGAFDIVINGVSLMHIARYDEAIAEGRRVARRWCIFHTVPTVAHRATTFLRKKAYGHPTIEVIFNESELVRIFEHNGLQVRHVYASVPYDLSSLLGEPTPVKTYLCEVMTPCAT